MYDFLLPDIGEGLHEAEIVKWFVEVGQTVKENELLVEVQTDKATVEITAPVSGQVLQFGGEEGDTIMVGSLLCQFETEVLPIPPLKKEEYGFNLQSVNSEYSKMNNMKAAPSVRRAARNAGVLLQDIVGTGPHGRILRSDLEHHLQRAERLSPLPKELEQKVETTNEQKVVPIKGVRKTIFHNMQKAISNAVLCTGMDKVNVTKLVSLKKELLACKEFKNVKLTYLPFILKATALALEKHEEFNATVDEENIALIIHSSIHIGVAVATNQGLLVPVIRDVNKKSIYQIALDLDCMLEKLERKTLTVADLKGSTFTVSSTGKDGGTFATPIPNYPEISILGVHKITKEPIIVGEDIAIGHTMTLSCTFDHRVIDGEPAGRFMREVAGYLENPLRLML